MTEVRQPSDFGRQMDELFQKFTTDARTRDLSCPLKMTARQSTRKRPDCAWGSLMKLAVNQVRESTQTVIMGGSLQ
jgi:hypothetical protein